jgi:hypothetical protein
VALPSEHQTLSLLNGLLVFVAGALIGGVVHALVERYAVFKESKGVAMALRAEINAFLGLVTFRDYVAITDRMIVRLRDRTHVVDLADVFLIRIAQDYFSVFHALSPKIGLLGPLGRDVVLTYAAAKALLEDIALVREESQAVIEGRKNPTPDQIRASLLEATTQINRLLREAMAIATNTSAALEAFADRRWLCIFK